MADGMLATERLVLRPPVEDDLTWVLADLNTENVLRHLGGVRSPTLVAERFADDISAFNSGSHQRWTVWLHDGATRVGRVGLFPVRATAAPPVMRGQHEIGWTFAEGHWRKGYATEAARAVLVHAFDSLGVSLIYSQTSQSNAASTRMMQRLGFVRRAALDYVDPDYAVADNPTTVWSMDALV